MGRGLVSGGNSVNGGGEREATPIFDALLTELALEWRCGTAWDPDAPNAWFDPAIPPDPAAVTQALPDG